jgi:Fe-S-cluster containining protein
MKNGPLKTNRNSNGEHMTDPWYKDGLRFKCTGCGQCCTGSPGYVWLSEEEAVAIAEHLQISLKEFLKKYTRLIKGRLSLKEHPQNFDCVFLKGARCEIYPLRPKQCRTFPWWPENIKDEKSWEETALRCEGINHPDAPFITLGEIKKNLEP